MIGEIITGGLSLLGGLFGKKKQKVENTVDYVAMARNAEAAGFNPLTALRNGGSAGFTTTVSHPGLSGVSEAVSQIGGALGSALEKKIDPIEQKRQAVESALLDYQLGTIQNKAKAPMMFGDVPTKTGSSLIRQPSAPLAAKRVFAPSTAKANAPGEGTLVGGDDPRVSGLGWNNGRYGWHHVPVMPDGETLETIYGDSEILSTIYGGAKITGDAGYSAYRNAVAAGEDFGKYWERKKKEAAKSALPQTRHQADPGSWLDYAPKMPKTSW